MHVIYVCRMFWSINWHTVQLSIWHFYSFLLDFFFSTFSLCLMFFFIIYFQCMNTHVSSLFTIPIDWRLLELRLCRYKNLLCEYVVCICCCCLLLLFYCCCCFCYFSLSYFVTDFASIQSHIKYSFEFLRMLCELFFYIQLISLSNSFVRVTV